MKLIKIKDSAPSIQSKLENAFIKKYKTSLGKNFEKRAGEILNRLHDFLAEKFRETDTYRSLISGKLRADFGFSDEYLSSIDEAIDYMLELGIEFEIKNKKIILLVNFLPNTDNIHYYNSNGNRIDWLDWLLYSGTDEVVSNYRVSYRENKGRSHMAIMIGPNDEFSFQVDPDFAGVENDNWISKTLKNNIEPIKRFLIKELHNVA